MKILVTLKPVPDPEQPFALTGGRFDFSGAGIITNPFDEYALETALRLTDVLEGGKPVRGPAEIVAISMGEAAACHKVLKRALGLGVNRVIHVEAKEAQLDFSVVAEILRGVVEIEKPDLILMGKQSVDGDGGIVPGYLAGLLGLPQITAATAIVERPDSLEIEREIEGGTEVKTITLPAVVSVDLRVGAPVSVTTLVMGEAHPWAEGPRYPSIRGMLKTRSALIPPVDPTVYTNVLSLAIVEDGSRLPAPRGGGVLLEDVEALVEVLRPYLTEGEGQ